MAQGRNSCTGRCIWIMSDDSFSLLLWRCWPRFRPAARARRRLTDLADAGYTHHRPFFTRRSAPATASGLADRRRAFPLRTVRMAPVTCRFSARRLADGGRTVTVANLSIPGAVLSRAIAGPGDEPGTQRFRAISSSAKRRSCRRIRRTSRFSRAATTPTTSRSAPDRAAAATQRRTWTIKFVSGAPTSRTSSRASAARAPNARIVALNLPNLAASPYLAANPPSEKSLMQRVAVGLSDRVNALTVAQRAGRRSDVRAAALSAVELRRRRLPPQRRRLRHLRRARPAGAEGWDQPEPPRRPAPSDSRSLGQGSGRISVATPCLILLRSCLDPVSPETCINLQDLHLQSFAVFRPSDTSEMGSILQSDA